MTIVIAFAIILFSHLTVDTDFDEKVKFWSYVVYVILTVAYVVTRVIM